MAERETLDADTVKAGAGGETETPLPAPIDQPLEASSRGAQEDDPAVAEALKAWAAGGHTTDEAVGEEILPVQFAQLEEPPPRKTKPRFSRINNVNVDLTVELGRREMTVRELLNMKVQDVIDIEKLAGEPFEILVNKRPFAEGEIVVVTDLMAVRITRLIDRSPTEDEEE